MTAGPASAREPSLAVFLRRGRTMTRWSPADLLEPGDLLRFKVTPAGFHYLTLWTEGPAAEAPEVIFSGPVEEGHEVPLLVSLPLGHTGSDAAAAQARGIPQALVALFGRTRPPAPRLGATAKPEEERLLRLALARSGGPAAPAAAQR